MARAWTFPTLQESLFFCQNHASSPNNSFSPQGKLLVSLHFLVSLTPLKSLPSKCMTFIIDIFTSVITSALADCAKVNKMSPNTWKNWPMIKVAIYCSGIESIHSMLHINIQFFWPLKSWEIHNRFLILLHHLALVLVAGPLWKDLRFLVNHNHHPAHIFIINRPL